ncbi:26893_t:CDS:2 [Gigaspora margarita]|uniref:26893_t:CDS:1 n=1 Tax=Gigaspora margarita TaxID=4874 RepID=A0ABN7VGJ4_GIGMA|nr:26893_t:CDS:2 [Gigaspora margarita]
MFLKRNIKEERRNLVFYTDGSLLGIEHNSKMCAGWIQIDVDSDRALIEYAYWKSNKEQISLQAAKGKKLLIRDKNI